VRQRGNNGGRASPADGSSLAPEATLVALLSSQVALWTRRQPVFLNEVQCTLALDSVTKLPLYRCEDRANDYAALVVFG
jgi:hypothetical protein